VILATQIGLGSINISSDIVVNPSAFVADIDPVSGYGDTLTLSGQISGSGALTRGQFGLATTVVLSGDNSAFTGGITLKQGILRLSNRNALGTKPLTITTGAYAPQLEAGIALTGANALPSGLVINGNFIIGGSNDLEIASPIARTERTTSRWTTRRDDLFRRDHLHPGGRLSKPRPGSSRSP
jgi:autotransporter-associated beta strand protein